jgi:hypothetical protein
VIRARGVRLNGRLQNGKLRLGEVDKLMPPPTGKPFRLPNQRVEVADVGIRIDTPAGRLGLGLEGSGNLAYSFEGRIAAASDRLVFSDKCRIDAPRLFAAVRTEEERPSFKGPLRAGRILCGGVDLTRPSFALDTILLPGLDGARGSADLRIPQLRTGGNSVRGIAGRVTFDGGAKQVRGRMNLAAAGAAVGAYRSGAASINGRYALSPKGGQISLTADVAADRVSAGGSLAAVEAALRSAGGTPVEPVADALAAAVRRVGESFSARASLRLVNSSKYGAASVERLRAISRSGALVSFAGRKGVSYFWPAGATVIDTDFSLSGGGFPNTRLSLSQPRAGAPIRGVARVAPMVANGARLQFDRIDFTAGGGARTEVRTVATLSGPFNDGRVDGLVIPISGSFAGGGFVFGESCTQVGFQSLRASGLRLGRASLPLCPTGRALLWRNPGRSLQGGASIRQSPARRQAGAIADHLCREPGAPEPGAARLHQQRRRHPAGPAGYAQSARRGEPVGALRCKGRDRRIHRGGRQACQRAASPHRRPRAVERPARRRGGGRLPHHFRRSGRSPFLPARDERLPAHARRQQDRRDRLADGSGKRRPRL